MTYTYILLAIVLGMALDCATTNYALRKGLGEANPFMQKVFTRLGVLKGLIITHMVALIVVVMLQLTTPVLATLAVVWWGVVLWNSYRIYKVATK